MLIPGFWIVINIYMKRGGYLKHPQIIEILLDPITLSRGRKEYIVKIDYTFTIYYIGGKTMENWDYSVIKKIFRIKTFINYRILHLRMYMVNPNSNLICLIFLTKTHTRQMMSLLTTCLACIIMEI